MRIVARIAALLVIAAFILVALANRTPVLFSLDPLAPAADGLSLHAPLYWIIFAALFAGILLGGAAVWLGQRKKHLWAAGGQPAPTVASGPVEPTHR